MPARVRKIRHDDETRAKIQAARPEGRFYVYRIFDATEHTIYIGKGCGPRLAAQMARFNAGGEILRRFHSEDAAFAYERKLISGLLPEKNRNLGGAGGRATSRKPRRRTRDEMEWARLGPRVFAARALLSFDLSGFLSPPKIDVIRQVAYGGGA